MAASSAAFHEDQSALDRMTIERHRATASLMEELEAVDWYDQRIAATTDDELRAVLRHNRDEEKEHAAMTLEWLRRNDPALDRFLRTYLFTSQPITAVEAEADAAEAGADLGAGPAGLGVGALREDKDTL